jgi:hypothetical protein
LRIGLSGIIAAPRPQHKEIWGKNSHKLRNVTLDALPNSGVVTAVENKAKSLAAAVLRIAINVIAPKGRILLALGDTPTKRYGPKVEGAGVHPPLHVGGVAHEREPRLCVDQALRRPFGEVLPFGRSVGHWASDRHREQPQGHLGTDRCLSAPLDAFLGIVVRG